MNRYFYICIILIFTNYCNAQLKFTQHVLDTDYVQTMSVGFGDINNDGKTDVIAGAYSLNEINWWENTGNFNFNKKTLAYHIPGIRTIYVAEINKDNLPDIIGSSYGQNKLSWWRNKGDGNFEENVLSTAISQVHSACAADIDNDGDMDILAAAWGNSGIKLYENIAGDHFEEKSLSPLYPASYINAVDIDKDGQKEILFSHFDGKGGIYILKKSDAGYTSTLLSLPYAHWADVKDIDKDGDLDVAIVSCGRTVAWYENVNGAFVYRNITVASYINCYSCVVLSDIDNDGDIDVLTASEGDNEVAAWLNDGKQTFNKQVITNMLKGASDIAVVDLDKDGDEDILCAARFANTVALFENELVKNESVTDVDGNVYQTVKIGGQVWMKENLKAVHYADSTLIPDASGYNNSDSMANIYGRLYTWTAAMKNSTAEKAQGVCPCGWHIPTDGEWKTLENFLGGASVAGGKMKDTTKGMWKYSAKSGATNSSGFTLLPAGEYDANEFKKYQLLGEYAVFWTSTNIGQLKARERYIAFDSPISGIFDWFKIMKYSIRCIKDEVTDVSANNSAAPKSFVLYPNFPNPFNPETKISYSLPVQSTVTVTVFNILGQTVRELVNETKPAGTYSTVFNAGGLPTGIYFCKIIAMGINGNSYTAANKLVLIK